MTTANAVVNEVPAGIELGRGLGLPGRTAITWAVGGAVGLGGVVVGLEALTGNLSGNGLLVTAAALFIVGAILGFLHGAVLGVMGRPAEMSWRNAGRTVALAALYAVPALTVSFLVAGWIALTPIALYTGKMLPLIGSGVAWMIGAALLAYAAVEGWHALQRAYARWQEKRYGTVLVAATFAALLVTFLAARPQLWGMQLRLTEVGAVLLALSMTLWLVGPLVTLALRLIAKLPVPGAAYDTRQRVWSGTAVGLVAGAVVGLVAVPFAVGRYGIATPSADVGPAGAIVLAVSAALFNEVLLRFFLVTAVAALLTRVYATRKQEAITIAVMVAAAVEVLLHLPGVVMIGFPTMLGAAGFLLTAVVLPAVVFGVLFW
ncbi:MAG TPA: hypothetical protein VGD27_10990, partial [Longimicrobiales bacterium]